MEPRLLYLPLELICKNILYYLTPHETAQFARISRLATKIFKFDLQTVIDRAISEWSAFLFKCPECKLAVRAGSEITSIILVDAPPREQYYRTCRKCYFKVRLQTMKRLNALLVEYRKDRDHPAKYRGIAYRGICRYQEMGKYPRKRDLDFMQTIIKQLYS